MTSTSVNIGFCETKNSSRVLKPPGGGHSDIFGVRGDNDIQTPSKRKNQPQSTINSCFMHDIPNKEENLKKKEESLNQNGNGVVTDENTEPTKVNGTKDAEKNETDAVAPPRRGRVPPGGFSSGLW